MGLSKEAKRKRIHLRVRKKIRGTAVRPRLSVYRSNNSIYCQIIDDEAGRTIVSASSRSKDLPSVEGTKTDEAKAVGSLIGQKAKAANITNVVFDRGGNLYHGRVKALADGARESGLKL